MKIIHPRSEIWLIGTLTLILFGGCSMAGESDQRISISEETRTTLYQDEHIVSNESKEEAFAESESKSNRAYSLEERPSLENYILTALKNSAELRASFEAYKAALQKSPQVTSLPDPTLSFGYFINEIETRVGPQNQKIGFTQPIPWFGKLSLRGEIADSEARAAYYMFLIKKNELVAKLSEAYFEILYLKEAQNITAANLELLKRWEQVLLQRYRSQSSTQADLIKVQLELGMMEDKLRELRDLEKPLNAELNTLLNRPAEIEVILEPHSKDNLLTKSISSLDTLSSRDLESILVKNSPELMYYKALVDAKETGIKLANKNFYPDLGLGLDYVFVGDREQAGNEGGEDSLVAMLSMKVPLNRSSYKAGLRQARSEWKSLEELKKAREYILIAALSKRVFEIKDSKRKSLLYRDTLVPKADESLQSTYTAFEAGESSFIDLLDSERSYLQFKLSLARAETDLMVANAKLLAILGDFSNTNSSHVLSGGKDE